ncbi:hypothetical protein HW114_04845 [Serratia symbiotica]|uniref:hypothetical protein n=1 Tax=Serratia symbiotica TaxID=138074 RepID=UPI0013609554|nr:hypothetical protein [Serratia symbiotica]MBF1994884.1 hypothetical protein [Serratia symbiotica]
MHKPTSITVTRTTKVNPPDVTIQRTSQSVHRSEANRLSAVGQPLTGTTPPPPLNSQEFGAKWPGTYVTSINGRRVYSTNIDGIGYSIGGISGNNCSGKSGWVGTDSGGDPNHFMLCSAKGQFAH